MVQTKQTKNVMKVQTLAALAVVLRLSCTPAALADSLPAPSVERISSAVELTGIHSALLAGDSVIVIDRNSGHYLFSIRLPGSSQIELHASGPSVCSADTVGVDMHHLDHSGIGVITFDAQAKRWHLIHRLDLTQVTDASFAGMLIRFTAAAANASVRLSREISSRQ